MWVDPAWTRRGLAALHAMLDVDDHTRKAMIQFLFDEGFWDEQHLTWAAAIARWNDCLNPGKNSFFKMGELWALMGKFGRHHLFLAMAADLGYEVRRKATEERQQALLERLTTTLERMEREVDDTRAQLARLQAPAAPRLVSPHDDQAPARFAREDMAPGRRGF